VEPSLPPPGLTRETRIVRDAQGRWFNEGQPLAHENLSRAFDRWVTRADDGRWCLKNDINWAYITLEGPPFFVRAVRVDARGNVLLQLSNDAVEPLRARSLRTDDQGALYCDVGDGSMVARFDRHAATQLEAVIGEDAAGVYLEVAGERVRPDVVADPLQPLTTPAPAPTGPAKESAS
jgi:hypothetical protein